MRRFQIAPVLIGRSLLTIASIFVLGNGIAMQATSEKMLPTSTPNTQKNAWISLTSEQQSTLAPLANKWTTMDKSQKKKWMGLSNKFSAMKPEEQQRVQERMRDWVKLTPAQRMAARENFSKSTKITPEKKNAQWQQYQQLSDEQKQQLAAESKNKKNITTLQPDTKSGTKTLPPIKKGPAPATSNVTNAASLSSIK